MIRVISDFILKLWGWKMIGRFPGDVPKLIVIIAPHTSNWDFILGILAKYSLQIRASYLGKEELFRFPFGWIFRKLGGYPVDRFNRSNKVNAVVELFKKNDRFILALSPEGTRSRVENLRTGFYHMAVKAGVPLLMVGLDFGKKEIVIDHPFALSGHMENDFKKIFNFYRGMKGKRPHLGIDHLIDSKSETEKEELK